MMFILCPTCEDPKKNVWVSVTAETERYIGRFGGTQTSYVVHDVEQACECKWDKGAVKALEERAIEAYLED